MSVNAASSKSDSAAAPSMLRAITAFAAESTNSPHAEPAVATAPSTASTPKRTAATPGAPTTATSDAHRGAKAAPTVARATGAYAAGQGAAQLGATAPGTQSQATSPSAPYTPYAASTDAYAAQATPDSNAAGWDASWQQRFEQLQLAPADIEYLAQSGYTGAELDAIARELGEVDVIDPTATAPTPGFDAGTASSANGPLPQDVVPAGQPGAPTSAPASAWNAQWAQAFGDVMSRMGMPDAQIRSELASVQGQPMTELQLAEAYQRMEQSVGGYDQQWQQRFTAVMTKLKTPAAEQAQVLEQLAGSGMSESQLTEAYTRMQNSLPAWDASWDKQFRALDLPDELLKQLKDSGASKEALGAQLKHFTDLRATYDADGRLDKLKDADATPEQQWGVMTGGLEGKKFDEAVEQIHSSHVSGWKRIGSFALNLIPGVFAVQYLTGKDWVTGEKIDRTNPLNIVGAVASGFAGFTAVRGAVQGVMGLSAASKAATATMQAANATKGVTGLAASVEALGSASNLSRGAFQAIEGAGLVSKFEQGLRLTDYIKSAVPLINRFGEAGRLSAVGRGYYQGMQLAAGAAAMQAVEGGKVGIDAATRSSVLAELKQGRSINQALEAAGRGRISAEGIFTGTRAGGFSVDAAHVARDYSRYGFLQGGAGKLAEGNKLMRGNGVYRFSPFKNHASIGTTANPNVFSLGRNVNFGSAGGLAQGLGLVRGANSVSNPGLLAQATQRATGANNLLGGRAAQQMTGLNIADDVQRIETMRRTADYANKLGVADGGSFRSLLQLGASNRTAARMTGMVERGGDDAYRVGRELLNQAQRYGNFVGTPLVATSAIGMTGLQVQPYWDYLKNRKEIDAKEQAQRELADREAQELEQVYARQQAGGGGSGGGAQQPGATPDAVGRQVVGTSRSGGQLVYDPEMNAVIDAGNGDVYDPTTQQLIGNLAQLQGTPAAAASSSTSVPGSSGEASVYVDPATGRYVDPQTGLSADPRTGQVSDQQGNVVGTVSGQPVA